MASTWTTNSGIEKPGTGDQSGTWGITANNDFDVIDRSLHGVTSISLSGTSDNTTIYTDTASGTLSVGQYRTFILGGSPDSSTQVLATPFVLTVTPSTVQKLYAFRNTTSSYIQVGQGSGTKALIYPNASAIIYLDGGGTTANAFDISSAFNYLSTINGGTVAGVTNFTSTVGIGSASPTTTLELKADDTPVTSFSGSISGTTLTTTTTPSPVLTVGNYIFGPEVQPNTYVTGGSGTSWTVSTSQTVPTAGGTVLIYAIAATKNRIRFTDSDTAVVAGQPIGTVEFYTSDTTPSAGVGAFVSAISESDTPDVALVFGTKNNSDSGVAAIEAMRITSNKYVGINTTTPAGPLHVFTSGTSYPVIVESSDAGAAAAPSVLMYRNSASPAAADSLGAMTFRGKNSAATTIDYAQIASRAPSVTSAGEVGALAFQTATGSTLVDRMVINSTGVGVGTSAPSTALEVSGATGEITTCSGYIYDGTTSGTAGTVLNVTAASGVALAVGQYIYGPGITPNTYITAFISGSGTTGTYRISASQVLATSGTPSTTIYVTAAATNRIRITDTDTSVQATQPIGTLEFYTNDADAPGAGVGAFVSAVNATTSPDIDLIFGTRDNPATNAGSGAVERMRISQSLISYTIPQAIAGASTLAASASITTTAANDGTKTAYESYALTPIGGNMRYLTNNVGTVVPTGATSTSTTATVTFGTAFVHPVGSSITVAGMSVAGYNGTFTVTASSAGSVSYAISPGSLASATGGTITSGINIAAPTATGDYTMVLQITNGASAGNISLSGFSKTTGVQFTRTSGDDFMVYVTKLNGFTVVNVVALQ